MKQIKKILYEPILDRDEKIEEIKKFFYNPKKFFLKPKKHSFQPIRIGNAFSSNYIEYKSNGDKGSDMINNHKIQGEQKIHLTMAINFFCSIDSEEIRTMHSKSDNIGIMMGSETDEIIENLFDSFLQRYQKGLQEPMKGSEFVSDGIDSMYYKLHKISLKRGGSYINSPEWLKNKKATINPKNKDDKCFKYSLTAALNHKQIGKDPQRITKIKPFIDQYSWKETDFPSHKKD